MVRNDTRTVSYTHLDDDDDNDGDNDVDDGVGDDVNDEAENTKEIETSTIDKHALACNTWQYKRKRSPRICWKC